MAESPEQRLERLRREVLREGSAVPVPPPATPAPGAAAVPTPTRAASPRPATAVSEPAASDDGWSLREAIGSAGAGTWVGLGLLAVGAYLLLSRFVPGLSLVGSAALLLLGVGALALHLRGRAGPWALYAGAVLTGVGGARLLASLVPLDLDGVSSIGIGVAFLVIAFLRHSQAGGYGWQGALGAVLTGYGLFQLGLSLLPGSPGLLDLVLPVALLAVGAVIVLRTFRPSRPATAD